MSAFETDIHGDFVFSEGRLTLETDPLLLAGRKFVQFTRIYLGEWFLDTRIGVPYFSEVFVKKPDLEIIRRLFRRILLAIDPISEVDFLEVYFQSAERTAHIEFSARAADGRTITGGPGQPLIVSGVGE